MVLHHHYLKNHNDHDGNAPKAHDKYHVVERIHNEAANVEDHDETFLYIQKNEEAHATFLHGDNEDNEDKEVLNEVIHDIVENYHYHNC